MAITTHIPNQVFENISKQPDPTLSGHTPWQAYIDEADKMAGLLGVRSVNTTNPVSYNPPAQWSVGTGGAASTASNPTVLDADRYVYIVAGNFKEYTEYVDRKDYEWRQGIVNNAIPPYFYINVSHVDKLMGLNRIQGFFIGSYEQRNDIDLIRRTIKSIKGRTV